MHDTLLPVGKLPPVILESLLKKAPIDDQTIILGPGPGLDCAVVDVGDKYLVLKSDPITFATDEIGWYLLFRGPPVDLTVRSYWRRFVSELKPGPLNSRFAVDDRRNPQQLHLPFGIPAAKYSGCTWPNISCEIRAELCVNLAAVKLG